jgi:glyoxylase-like metal-dependent hydrolase (beta-lactamase superfamily II)
MRPLLLLVMLIAMTALVTAQRHAEAVLSDYDTVTLAPGVFAFVAPESKTPFVSGNSVVVIGDTAALVVDSTNMPSLAEKMIADIRRRTDKPVRYLVNTHWHPDHLMGNAAYAAAFQGLSIVASDAMRRVADVQVPAYLEQTLGPSGIGTIETLRRMVASGTRADGSAITASDRDFYELELADYEAWAADAKRTHYVAPTITFDREMTIDLGSRTVRVMFLGRGNTAGDAVVYVPDAKVVATGDLIVGPTPYATASFLREWIDVLDRLTHVDASVIVPGHGPVEHDWTHAGTIRALLRSVVDQVDGCVARGLSLDDTRKHVDVSKFRDEMTGGDSFRQRAFDTFFLATAVDRAFRDAMYSAQK